MLATTSPFPVYAALDGDPLDGGKLYFGAANGNPESSPVTVYWDAAGTQPAAQPILTMNGYTVRSGSPAVVYVNGDYSMMVRDRKGRQVAYMRNSADFSNDQALQALIAILTTAGDAAKAAGAIPYSAALNYAAGTVGFELNKRKSVFATGVADTDVANMQAAINGAADYTCIDFFGAFLTNATITLKPKIWLRFDHATITHSNSAADLFAYTPGAPTGFPGQIIVENIQATGPGNVGTATMLKIDANAPGICVKGGMAGGFYQFIYLRDAYGSVIDHFRGYTCTFGIQLVRESHASTIRDTLIDGATIAGVAINYGGGAGTGTIHNVQVIGGALQNSANGVWAENCLELHTVGVYHEGNTVADYRIGVADGGLYARACYNAVIDGFSSSSPCGGGKNIRIEHSVGVQVRAAAWNSGCSTTATLASYDGFSDRIDIDIMRFTTTTPTATVPVDCTADPKRGVVRYRGRPIFGSGVTDAISGGTLASKLWNLGHQQIGGRDSAVLKSILDVVLQVGVGGVVKVKDSAGNDQFSFAIPLASSTPGAGSKSIWYDPADSNRVKFAP